MKEAADDTLTKESWSSNNKAEYLVLLANQYATRSDSNELATKCPADVLPFHMGDLNCVLAKNKTYSAPGLDGISYNQMQALSPTTVRALMAGLNRIWLSGQPPTEWSNIKIVPVIKKPKTGPTS